MEMNRIVGLVVAILMLWSGIACGGLMRLCSSRDGNCYYSDRTPGVFSVYVYLYPWPSGATGCSFRVVADEGFTASFIGDVTFFYVVGNSQDGVIIWFLDCLNFDIDVLKIVYYGYGTSAPCTLLRLVPHPESETGEVEYYDCSSPYPQAVAARTCDLMVNPYGCEPPCVLTPTQETTWGAIKSLYGLSD